jgi:hypothetical protein
MTQEQQNIIDKITEQFEMINAQATIAGGIIDIEGITGLQDKIMARDKEIALIQQSYDEARNVQMLADFRKLQPQIEALGLQIKNGLAELIISDPAGHHTDTFYISYAYTRQEKIFNKHYSPYRWSWFCHTPKIFYNRDMHYSEAGFDNIEEFVTSDKFKAKLGEMYRRLKERGQ